MAPATWQQQERRQREQQRRVQREREQLVWLARQQQQQQRERQQREQCYDFVKGVCQRGDECRYSHDLRLIASTARGGTQSQKSGELCYDYLRPSLPYAADNDIRRPDQPISGSIPSHKLHSLPPQFPTLPRPSQGYDPGPGNAQQVSQGLASKSNFEAQPDAFPHFHHQQVDQASQQMHPYGHRHQHAQQQQHRQLPYPGHVYGGDSEHMAQGMLRSHSAPHPLATGFGVTPLSVSAIISSLGNAHPQFLAETLAGLAAAAQAQAQQTHAHHGMPGPGAAQSSHRLPPRAPMPMAPPHPPTQYYVASHTPGHAAEDAKSLPCSKPSSGLTTASSSPVAGQGSCPQPIPPRHNPSSQSSSSWSASLPRQLAAGTASSNCVGWALSGVDSPSGPLGALEGLLPGPQVPPPPPAVRAPLSSTAQLVPDLLPLLKEIWNKP
ncbi:hypothetical protein QJQ45_005901 [Haematococcus lacustris]|nr:hypothetical protein QJQ45_005901 [Haematococcus lacustris]